MSTRRVSCAGFPLISLLFVLGLCQNLWGAENKGVSGLIDDPAFWKGERLPSLGERSWIQMYGNDCEVRYPEGNFENNYAPLYNGSAGKVLTVDGHATRLLAPGFTTGNGVVEPLHLYLDGQRVFDIENYWDQATKNKAFFAFSNFVFRIVGQGLPEAGVHFDQGHYEFHRPVGEYNNTKHVFFTGSSTTPRTITFHEGTSSAWSSILWQGNSPKDTLRFEGGRHTIAGGSNFTYFNNTKDGTDNCIEVVSNANLIVQGGTLGDSLFPNRKFSFVADEGGRIQFGGYDFYSIGQGYARYVARRKGVLDFCGLWEVGFGGNGKTNSLTTVEVSDGGMLHASEALQFSEYTSKVSSGRSLLSADQATLEMKKRVAFNPYSEFQVRDSRWKLGPGTLSVCTGEKENQITDTEIQFGGSFVAEHGQVRMSRVTGTVTNFVVGRDLAKRKGMPPAAVTVEDGKLTHQGNFVVGADLPGSRLQITGGEYFFRPITDQTGLPQWGESFCIGDRVAAQGVLDISGEDTRVRFQMTDSASRCDPYLGNEGQGKLVIRGGVTEFGGGGDLFYIASQATSTGILHVVDGKLFLDCNVKMCRGTAKIQVDGGYLESWDLQMAAFPPYANRPAGKMALVMNGGYFKTGWVTPANQAAHANEIRLDGGVLECTRIISGSGAQVNGGTGSAVLSANGGTIRALYAGEDLISKMDSAVLGEKGLTIDADRDASISQDFTAGPEGRGLLAKTGFGTLTIAGNLAKEILIDVREGTVVLPNSASFEGKIVVTNNATLSLAGNTTIGELVLGDENTSGALSLAEGATLTVTGACTVMNDGSRRDLVLEKDEAGVTRIHKDPSAAKTLTIIVEQGVSNVTGAVTYPAQDTLKAIVSQGAELNLSGAVSRGRLEKRGGGVLFLTNEENRFLNGIMIAGGLLDVSSQPALGFQKSTAPSFSHEGGTLTLRDPAGTIETAMRYQVSAVSSTDAVVLNTVADVSLRSAPRVERGVLIKRGAGTLTIDPKEEGDVILSVSNGKTIASNTPNRGYVVAFDEEGTVPTDGFGGFNIAEGEILFKGRNRYYIDNSVMIGMRTRMPEARQPVMRIDGAFVHSVHGGYLFTLGGGTKMGDFPNHPALYLTNNAELVVDTLCPGQYSSNKDLRPLVSLDHSSVQCTYMLWANEGLGKAWFDLQNGSALYSGRAIRFNGDATLVLTNSVLAKDNALNCFSLRVENTSVAKGTVIGGSGSTICLNEVNLGGIYGSASVIFDGATWMMGENALSLRALTEPQPGQIRLLLQGAGATVPVRTRQVIGLKISGDGALTKTGPGDLVFEPQYLLNAKGAVEPLVDDPISWGFTGELLLNEGTVTVKSGATDASAAARLANGTTLALEGKVAFGGLRGSGTVTGGSFSELTLPLEISDAGTASELLTFADTATEGRVIVDLGRGSANPLRGTPYPAPFVVAKYTGTAPDVANWRIRNTGLANAGAEFEARDGEIICKLRSSGTKLILR